LKDHVKPQSTPIRTAGSDLNSSRIKVRLVTAVSSSEGRKDTITVVCEQKYFHNII